VEATPYCRALEDNSGFIVAQPIIRKTSPYVEGPREFICPKWERVLGLGNTPKQAWADSRAN
jgi:hypothetical protein